MISRIFFTWFQGANLDANAKVKFNIRSFHLFIYYFFIYLK